jgi:DNA-binding transcriptional LysR family regulator
MELRQLRHFVAVVDLGNLSKAADRVAISQPALTRSIKNLEDTLRVQLLDRKPRGVVPTEAGLALYHHASVVLNACQQMTREVRELERGITGSVRLGIGSMFSRHVVDDAVVNLANAHPRLALTITSGFYEDLIRNLIEGRLDLIFSSFPHVAVSSDLRLEPLLRVRSPIVVGDRHPIVRRKQIARRDLIDQRWVIVDQPHAQDTLQAAFAAEGLPGPLSLLRTSSLNLMIALVESGGFVSQIPEHLIQPQLDRGRIRVVTVANGAVERNAGLIYRDFSLGRPGVAHVVDALRRTCAKFKPGDSSYVGTPPVRD